MFLGKVARCLVPKVLSIGGEMTNTQAEASADHADFSSTSQVLIFRLPNEDGGEVATESHTDTIFLPHNFTNAFQKKEISNIKRKKKR